MTQLDSAAANDDNHIRITCQIVGESGVLQLADPQLLSSYVPSRQNIAWNGIWRLSWSRVLLNIWWTFSQKLFAHILSTFSVQSVSCVWHTSHQSCLSSVRDLRLVYCVPRVPDTLDEILSIYICTDIMPDGNKRSFGRKCHAFRFVPPRKYDINLKWRQIFHFFFFNQNSLLHFSRPISLKLERFVMHQNDSVRAWCDHPFW